MQRRGQKLRATPGRRRRTVLDVPAKLAARARVFDTGHGRKTDATDARSVALVALRSTGLHHVKPDDHTVALRLLVDRRDELGRARTDTVNRLHKLLTELIPGGAKKFLSATQARALLATVRPRDVVGRIRRQLAAELIVDLATIDHKMTAADKHLTELLDATGTGLRTLYGIGPSSAARILAMSATSAGSPTADDSPAGTAPHPSTPPAATTNAIDSPARATDASTGSCTSWPSSNSASSCQALAS